MDPASAREGLVVSSSRTPVVRAGHGNAILFMAVVAGVMCNQILVDAGAPAWTRIAALIGLGLGALKVYSWNISRLYIRDGRTLVLVGPVSESAIDLSEIVSCEIGGVRASQFVSLKLKLKSSIWPRYRFFTAVATNFGPYAETRARLRQFMAEALQQEQRPGCMG